MSSRFAETRIRGYGSDVSFATDTGELASPHIYHFITWASFSDFFYKKYSHDYPELYERKKYT